MDFPLHQTPQQPCSQHILLPPQILFLWITSRNRSEVAFIAHTTGVNWRAPGGFIGLGRDVCREVAYESGAPGLGRVNKRIEAPGDERSGEESHGIKKR